MVLTISGHTSMLVSNVSPQAKKLSGPVQRWDTENAECLDSKTEGRIAMVSSDVMFQ